MQDTKIELKDVILSLGIPPVKLLDHGSLVLKPEIHCLLGPNGAGKTLTNRICALVESVTSGEIIWNGKVINPFPTDKLEFIRRIGYMRQEPAFVKRTVYENLALPLQFRGYSAEEIDDKVHNILDLFEQQALTDLKISTLSTGQRQKVALARTLITDPDFLILDEPTSSLDMKTTKWFETMIQKIQQDNPKIILWTTHDQFQVKRIANRVSIIINGRIFDTGDVSSVIENQTDPILREYLTGELIELD